MIFFISRQELRWFTRGELPEICQCYAGQCEPIVFGIEITVNRLILNVKLLFIANRLLKYG